MIGEQKIELFFCLLQIGAFGARELEELAYIVRIGAGAAGERAEGVVGDGP